MQLPQEYIVKWIINPEELLIGRTVTIPWILDTGFWDSAAFWTEDGIWQ
jgi:hypothetical protein